MTLVNPNEIPVSTNSQIRANENIANGGKGACLDRGVDDVDKPLAGEIAHRPREEEEARRQDERVPEEKRHGHPLKKSTKTSTTRKTKTSKSRQKKEEGRW